MERATVRFCFDNFNKAILEEKQLTQYNMTLDKESELKIPPPTETLTTTVKYTISWKRLSQ